MPAGTVAEWLSEIGLAEYIDAFEREQIGLDLVPDLTDADLAQLGLPMGPRKRVLKAAAGMHQASAVRAPAAPPAQAQRRQLTVMFCDLVGSTALSQSLDPEDLREVMRSYQEAARQVIQRYDGHVAQYLGDGVMVYFGWPAGHGDEARRAVRSGLEIVEAVARLEAPVKLAVRVGIATGMVVIGETGDGDASEPKTAVGDTPNIAARLQALAQPGMVVIAQLTRTLAREAFEYQSLGEHALKGIAEPVQAWSVVGVRDEAPEQDDQTELSARSLVGRDEEIGLLQRAWQQSKDRRGRVVLVSGEPGIGKSALVESLLTQLHGEGVRRITVRCSAYHISSALYPVIEHVKKLIDWQSADAPEANITRLERRLQSDGLPVEELVPALASLLSLPLPEGRYTPLNLTPQQIKQRILDNLAEWLFTIVDVQPAVMVWEDLHWADPSTLEYLGLLIEQSPTAPLLLVLTFRPEFSPPWTARSHLTPITLNRLEPPQIEHMVNRLAKGKPVPEQVLDHIVRKTDGVPLFVEELTKTILGSPVLRETESRYELAGPLSAVAIPATLHESLMARLDRLPLAREVAQLGAVLGREFSYEVLLALGHGKAPAALEEGLTELIAGEVLYQRGRPPRARYVFKHALIQEAAYQSLLKRVRRQYHREVAQLLEARFPQQVETEPELVAYHYAGADMAPEAIGYWLKAAKRAANRSAYREALTHLDAGTALVEGLSAGRDRIQLEVQLQVARAGALHATMGLTDKTTIAAYSAAEALCRQLGDEWKETHMHVLWQLTASAGVRGEWQRSYTNASELLIHAEAAQDKPGLMNAHRIIGFSSFCMGDPARGRNNLEQGAALYDYEAHRGLAAVYGQDPGVGVMAILSWALIMLGFVDQALQRARAAVALAERLAHPHSHAYALHYAAVVHLERGEHDQAVALSEAALGLSNRYGFQVWGSLSKIVIGQVRVNSGQAEEGVIEIRRGIAELQGARVMLGWPTHLLGLATALKLADRADEALGVLSEALDAVENTGERRAEAIIYRLKGELLQSAVPPDLPGAESSYQRALEIARAQRAKLWELRAATALARWRVSQGRGREARDLLQPVYAWFTEGLDTRDLKEAKALLDTLDAAAHIR